VASIPEPVADLEIRRAADHRETRWRNGAGSTLEIAHAPSGTVGDGFAWRVSIARLDVPAPFSAFPGIDRILMPIGGAGVLLDVAGVERFLPPGEPLAFAGEAQVGSRLPDGPTRCLNLMTRRGGPHGTVGTVVVDDRTEIAVPVNVTLVVVAVSGDVVAGRPGTGEVTGLQPLDVVILRGPAVAALHGRGTVAVVEVGR
jgi:uncharacterized protein